MKGISTRLLINRWNLQYTLSLSFGSAPCSSKYPTMSALFLYAACPSAFPPFYRESNLYNTHFVLQQHIGIVVYQILYNLHISFQTCYQQGGSPILRHDPKTVTQYWPLRINIISVFDTTLYSIQIFVFRASNNLGNRRRHNVF